MDAARAKKWMQLFNEKIQDQKAYLSDLDTPIGDGDHGGNMARGMAAAVESLAARDFASAAEVFQAVSLQSGDLTREKIGSLVEATKDLKATKGRASYVGERSIGHIDPGSASSGLLFEALLETEAG